MRRRVVVEQSSGERIGLVRPITAVDANLTVGQLIVRAFILPLPGHAAFNAAAALGMWILGHPWLGLALFVSATGFDAAKQVLLRKWLARPEPDEAHARRRMAVLCSTRVVAYTWPTFAMAMGGGTAEVMFYGM